MLPAAYGSASYACPPQLQRRLHATPTVASNGLHSFGATVRSSSATFAANVVPMNGFAASVRSSSLAGSTNHFQSSCGGLGLRYQHSSTSTTSSASNNVCSTAPTHQHLHSVAGVPSARIGAGQCRRAVVTASVASVIGGASQRSTSSYVAVVAADLATNHISVHDVNAKGINVAGCMSNSAMAHVEDGTVHAISAVLETLSPHSASDRPGDCLSAQNSAVPPAVAGGEDDDDDPESDEDVIAPSRSLFSASKKVLLISTINFIFRSISRDDSELSAMPNAATFKAFQEEQYHENKASNAYLDPFTRTLQDSSPGHVTQFILNMLHRGYFDVSEFIISVLYLVRFKANTGISLHVSAWRPLFITSLLLADKMWEDKSVKNSSLTMLFPVLSNAELFDLEVRFLEWLGFSAWITRKDFQQFCEELLHAEDSAPEISSEVLNSEYVAALQDGSGSAEVPSALKQPDGHIQRTAGKGFNGSTGTSGVFGSSKIPTRPEQPWNARKTLHTYSPSKRTAVGQFEGPFAAGKGVFPVPHNGATYDGDIASGIASPRRKALQPSQCSVGVPGLKGGSFVNPTGPTGAVRNRSNDRESFGIAGIAADTSFGPTTSAAQSPRRPAAVQVHTQERRPMSEPRVSPHSSVVGASCAAKGRLPSNMINALTPYQQRISVQPMQSAVVASPRHDRPGVPLDQKVGAAMQSDRCASEPAALSRSAQHFSASMPIGSAQAQSMPAQTAQHNRSASAVAQVCQPVRDVQQRLAFPFGPTSRSTVPMPGPARTARQPMVVAAHMQDQRRHAMQGGSQISSVALLARGRSSSPAGNADGGFVPPPSARRNVAAPPPTMRPRGLRFG